MQMLKKFLHTNDQKYDEKRFCSEKSFLIFSKRSSDWRGWSSDPTNRNPISQSTSCNTKKFFFFFATKQRSSQFQFDVKGMKKSFCIRFQQTKTKTKITPFIKSNWHDLHCQLKQLQLLWCNFSSLSSNWNI